MSILTVPTLRHQLLQRLQAGREETDNLFNIIQPAARYDRPIPERHRIVFYIGHLEAFDWNLLRHYLKISSFRPDMDRLFAFGIDPVDGGLPSDSADEWPAMEEVAAYRDEVRQAIDHKLEQTSEDAAAIELMNIAIEHRLMHAETLEYMFHQVPYDRKVHPASRPEPATQRVIPEMIEIPDGIATLGLKRSADTFGWDNEFEQHTVHVQRFSIDRYKVTNGQFLEFLNAGGYRIPELWSAADFAWVSEAGISHPVFWVKSNNGWNYRSMFDEFPLPLSSPVYVSQAEASAFAKWAGKQLPTEAEWHRAAYATRDREERQYPWGDSAPSESRTHWDPQPAGSSPNTRSDLGVEDLIATGWEWTSTEFAPFPGFRITPAYPGYSANFFDGKHFVMKGGSPRTAACMLRRSFRNWFQAHYQYVYAGFRCVVR